MKLPWLLTSLAIGAFGYMTVTFTHENVATNIDRNSTPGRDIIQYQQRDPGLGKLVGFACVAGVAVCLLQATKEECKQEGEELTTVSRTGPRQAPAYDIDPEIEATEVMTPVKQSRSQQSADHPIDLIADCDGKKRHVFVACQTQTGKTTTILSAIERKHQLAKGECEFTIFDPKQSFWLGLEEITGSDGKPCVVSMSLNNPGSIVKLRNKLDWLVSKMTVRQRERNQAMRDGQQYQPKPHVIVFDEFPSILKLAQNFDAEQREVAIFNKEPAPPSILGQILRNLEMLILNGLEDGLIVWLITQMPDLKQNKLDSGMRDQFAFWCQGRAGDFTSLEGAFINNWIVKGNGKELTAKLAQWRKRDRGLPIVYSNIGGHRIFEMPPISEAIKRKRVFGSNSNVVELRPPVAAVVNGGDVDDTDPWDL